MLLGAVWAAGRMLLVTAGVLGVGVYLSKRLTRKTGPVGRTIRLGAAHELHVVEVDGDRLLVGTSPGAAPSLLRVLDPAEDLDTSGCPSVGSGDRRGRP